MWTLMWLLARSLGLKPSSEPIPVSWDFSHPVLVTLPLGKGPSISPLIANPHFVDLMMGWPRYWTDCRSAVTGLSRWLERMRTELSTLHSGLARHPRI